MNRSMSETENIRLGQYLKLLGLAATGGEAKILIQDGYVRVNGEVETRRKRQLQDGDKVEVGEYVSIVQYGPDPDEPTDESA
jgi:ribosome-associated protein